MVVGMVVFLATASAALGFGTFRTYEPYPTGGTSYGVAIADLNKDGNGDVVASDDGSPAGHVAVFLGQTNGKGFLKKPPRLLNAGNQPEGVAIGNLNGAGRKDIAVANYGASTVSVFFARTGPGFRKRTSDLAAGPGAWQLAVADLNRDGNQDIVTGNYSTTAGHNVVSVRLGKGNGNFKSRHSYDGCNGAIGVGVARMNGDKLPDVVVVCFDGSVSVLLDHANGTLAAAKTRPFAGGSPSYAFGVATADFNRDGNVDVAVGNTAANEVDMLPGKGTGGLKAPLHVSTVSQQPNGIGAGDFNRDGKMDIAFGHYGSPFGIGILRGRGDGTFRTANAHFYGGSANPESLAVGRVNADKVADVVVGTDGTSGYGMDVFINKRIP